MAQFNQMQEIKRRFFALRNGIVADTIRKGGLGYKMVFGLNLPQIMEIAEGLTPSAGLASELWADKRTRESMLLAPMVYPREAMTCEKASEWLGEVPTTEVADILCHRLLRHLPFAWDVAMCHIDSPVALQRYAAFRLLFNVVSRYPSEIKPFAEAEYAASEPLTRSLCHAILEEIEFLLG